MNNEPLSYHRAAWVILALLFVLGIGGAVAYYFIGPKPDDSSINSFEECSEAGYPIMESYPAQCNTKDGRHFIQEVPSVTPYYYE